MVAWGDMTPSVPPDMTKATFFCVSSSVQPVSAAISLRNAKVDSARVKSFTQPLPSVFPRTAMISFGSTRLSSIMRFSSRTSSGADISILNTSIFIFRTSH